MYCARCGVHLSKGQSVCPVCDTRVYHPDIREPEENTYPKIPFKSEEFNRKGLMFVITMIFLIPLLLPVILELGWHDEIDWSGYVAGGVLLFYIAIVLPNWFKKPNLVIFTPVTFAATILYLLYICLATGESWFMSFAFPAFGSLGLIITAAHAILHYVRKGVLFTIGGALILLGGWTVLLEALIRITFDVGAAFYWSGASLTALFVIGMMLIIIGIVKPLKESLRRIFFIGKV